MSKENLVKLMQTAGEDEQLMAKLQQANSYEEVKNLALEQDLDLGHLSVAEAKRTIKVATGTITDELSDEELEMVAGGAYDLNPNDLSFNIGMPPKKGKSAIVDWLGSLE